MKSVRLALLAGAAFAAGSVTTPAIAAETAAIVLAQADDAAAASLAAAEAAVAAARAALEEAQANDGDVAAAQAQLDAALVELASAQAAIEATSAAEPEAEPAVEEPPPAPEETPAPPPQPTDEAPAEPVEEAPADDAQAPPPAVEEAPPAETPPVPEPAAETPPPADEPAEATPAEEPSPAEESAAPSEAQQTPAAEAEAAAQPADTGQAEPESIVEEQLEVQGDDEEAQNFRDLRQRFRRQQDAVEDEQAAEEETTRDDDRQARGDRHVDDRDGRNRRRERDVPPDADIVEDFGARFIIRLGETLLIQQDDRTETERFLYGARDVDVENLRGGRTRTTITRADGVQIVTIRDRYGEIIVRTRVDRRGREFVLIDNRDFYRDDGRRPRYQYDYDLPPLRLNIPRDEYFVDTRRADRQDIRRALNAPPVELVERPYALQEVLASERLRDKMRRIDLSTITFDFGSAAISPTQFQALTEVGRAMEDVLAERPDEVFLIEGHTDAVGTDYANLLLSDQRAEGVAVTLSSNFDIPPENLVTQGYGEQFLKISTDAAERENRRVAVLRITDLVRAAAN